MLDHFDRPKNGEFFEKISANTTLKKLKVPGQCLNLGLIEELVKHKNQPTFVLSAKGFIIDVKKYFIFLE